MNPFLSEAFLFVLNLLSVGACHCGDSLSWSAGQWDGMRYWLFAVGVKGLMQMLACKCIESSRGAESVDPWRQGSCLA